MTDTSHTLTDYRRTEEEARAARYAREESGMEQRMRMKNEQLRRAEVYRRIEIAKGIEAQAAQIAEEAVKKIAALAIEMYHKCEIDTDDFAQTWADHVNDANGDTFGGAVGKIEEEI